jgi:alcohol dehydrogenase class IV
MKAFTFQAPPNILFEAGASRKLAEIVAGYRVTRVLLVTDQGVRKAGLTKHAEKDLTDSGCELTVFEDVEADPPSHVIERAVTLCRDKGIGLVASIGGGSALDTAKLVAYLAKTPSGLMTSMASALRGASVCHCFWCRPPRAPVRRSLRSPSSRRRQRKRRAWFRRA